MMQSKWQRLAKGAFSGQIQKIYHFIQRGEHVRLAVAPDMAKLGRLALRVEVLV